MAYDFAWEPVPLEELQKYVAIADAQNSEHTDKIFDIFQKLNSFEAKHARMHAADELKNEYKALFWKRLGEFNGTKEIAGMQLPTNYSLHFENAKDGRTINQKLELVMYDIVKHAMETLTGKKEDDKTFSKVFRPIGNDMFRNLGGVDGAINYLSNMSDEEFDRLFEHHVLGSASRYVTDHFATRYTDLVTQDHVRFGEKVKGGLGDLLDKAKQYGGMPDDAAFRDDLKHSEAVSLYSNLADQGTDFYKSNRGHIVHHKKAA